jgi:hypothetical protein
MDEGAVEAAGLSQACAELQQGAPAGEPQQNAKKHGGVRGAAGRGCAFVQCQTQDLSFRGAGIGE